MLYDPTIFENLKVAIENQLYDRDNIDQTIYIAGRKDILDMAVMEREFRLKFHLVGTPNVSAEIVLHASLTDLAAEILQQTETVPGCQLFIQYDMEINDEQRQCLAIEQALQAIWGQQVSITQNISHIYGERNSTYRNNIHVAFQRKISEEQMNDIGSLADHMVESLFILHKC
ncbi:hypothetical protein ACFSTH_06060 [Paenibacillus yanchengensis]|uniref:Uncharacterized protein n=1 Tax=Paenibacillus yanchengensis TaxID=2035833 RepID=A0ABW4YHJ9_9BACL